MENPFHVFECILSSLLLLVLLLNQKTFKIFPWLSFTLILPSYHKLKTNEKLVIFTSLYRNNNHWLRTIRWCFRHVPSQPVSNMMSCCKNCVYPKNRTKKSPEKTFVSVIWCKPFFISVTFCLSTLFIWNYLLKKDFYTRI